MESVPMASWLICYMECYIAASALWIITPLWGDMIYTQILHMILYCCFVFCILYSLFFSMVTIANEASREPPLLLQLSYQLIDGVPILCLHAFLSSSCSSGNFSKRYNHIAWDLVHLFFRPRQNETKRNKRKRTERPQRTERTNSPNWNCRLVFPLIHFILLYRCIVFNSFWTACLEASLFFSRASSTRNYLRFLSWIIYSFRCLDLFRSLVSLFCFFFSFSFLLHFLLSTLHPRHVYWLYKWVLLPVFGFT